MSESKQTCTLMILAVVIAAVAMAILSGCASIHNPYTNEQAPEARAYIGDTGTSGSLKLGAVGEFSFVATWAKTADGVTTGTVTATVTKTTLNNGVVGALSFLAGLVTHAAH